MTRRWDIGRAGFAVGAVLAVGLGMAFRLWGSFAVPLWLDEAYSAYAASKGFAFLWQVVPRYETHPPFYYGLARLWSLAFGDGLPALRALGFAAALASFPVVGFAAAQGARIAGSRARPAALAALLLFALAPFPVEMAREVRPYPLMILVYALALAALLRMRRRAARGATLAGRAYAAYLAALAAMLWLHNLGPLYAAALGLGCLAAVLTPGMERRDWGWLIGGHAAVAAAWVPALLILADQAPTWMTATWLTFKPALLPVRVPMLYAGPGTAAALAALALAALGLRRLFPGRWRTAAILLAAAIVPLALSLAISATIAPVFILRTMTPVAVPAILLMALGATGEAWRARAAGLAILLLLLATMAATDLANRRAGPPQNWYGAVRWLAGAYRPGDLVLAYPNEGALPFDRAVGDLHLAIPSRPIPTPVPAIGVGGWYPTGSRGVVSLPRERLRAIARAPEVAVAPTVWLLRLGPWAYDKGDLFLHELSAGRRRVGHFRSGAIDIVGLRRAPPAGR